MAAPTNADSHLKLVDYFGYHAASFACDLHFTELLNLQQPRLLEFCCDLKHWVKWQVFASATDEARRDVCRKLVELACVCRARRNFHTCFVVVFALRSEVLAPVLHRSPLCVDFLRGSKAYRDLRAFTSKANTFAAYRREVQALAEANKPCLPAFRAVVTELKVAMGNFDFTFPPTNQPLPSSSSAKPGGGGSKKSSPAKMFPSDRNRRTFFAEKIAHKVRFALQLARLYAEQLAAEDPVMANAWMANKPSAHLAREVMLYAIPTKMPVPRVLSSYVDDPEKLPAVVRADLELFVDPGDVLLFSTKGMILTKLLRLATRSEYDHVAVVVRVPGGRLGIMQATESHGVDVQSVRAFAAGKLDASFSKIAVRKLDPKLSFEAQKRLDGFCDSVLGKRFGLHVSKFGQGVLRRASASLDGREIGVPGSDTIQQDRTFFCSELVAKAYKKMDLLEPHKAAALYFPSSFAQDAHLKLLGDQKLSKEFLLNLKSPPPR